MDFRMTGLPAAKFAPFFTMTNEALQRHRAVRCVADVKPGYPCRVSLEDAELGEEVLLLHFEHHAVDSPFRASHAVYVRRAATETFDRVNDVPAMLRTRLLSVRAFDARGMLVGADVADGRDLEVVIARLLAPADAAYLHVHFARAGCFGARVERA